jgi:hypothetical protein
MGKAAKSNRAKPQTPKVSAADGHDPKLVRVVESLPPQKWAPLVDAFDRSKSTVGSASLAAHELTRLLCEGDLTGAARRIVRGVSDTCFIFTKAFWQYVEIDSPTPAFGPQPKVRFAPNLHGMRGGAWFFFVDRAELDKRYPPVTSMPAMSMPANNPRGAGRKREYDREMIFTEAAAYVVVNDLPASVEALAHELQSLLGDRMPKDTQAKEILDPFYKRIKRALGRR